MSRGSVGPLVAIILGIIVILIIVMVFGKPLYRMVQPLIDPDGTFLPKAEDENVLIKGTQTQSGEGAPVRISGTQAQMQSRLVSLLLDCWKFRENEKYVCYRLELDMPTDGEVYSESLESAPGIRREDIAKEMERRGQPDAASAFRNNPVPDPSLADIWNSRRQQFFIMGYKQTSTNEVKRPAYKMCVDHDSVVNPDDLFLTHLLNFACE